MIQNRQIQQNDTRDIIINKNKLQELYKKQKELKDASLQNQKDIFNNNTQTQEIEQTLDVNTSGYTNQLSRLEKKLPVLLKTIDELNIKKPKLKKKKKNMIILQRGLF